MEKFKQEIWKEKSIFIEFDSLDFSQYQRLLNHFELKFNTEINNSDNVLFFNSIQNVLKVEKFLYGINKKNGFIQLCSTLNIDFKLTDYLIIIWDINSGDKFQIEDMKKYWSYIWYGTSDELCLLYFPNNDLYVLITDYGTIYL